MKAPCVPPKSVLQRLTAAQSFGEKTRVDNVGLDWGEVVIKLCAVNSLIHYVLTYIGPQ